MLTLAIYLHGEKNIPSHSVVEASYMHALGLEKELSYLLCFVLTT